MKRLSVGIPCLLAGMLLFAHIAHAGERKMLPLRNERPEVQQVYEALQAMPRGEGKASFRYLAPEMKADIWTLHLERFLDAHPDLFEEQREVIFEALGLLASGIAAKIEHTKDNHDADFAMLNALNRRVLAVFPRDLAAEAFLSLGTESTATAANPAPSSAIRRFHATPLVGDNPPCTCSSDNDWCDWITNPDNKCNNPRCTAVDGCGLFWMFWCDNICGPPR